MTVYLLKDEYGNFADRNQYDLWEGFQDLGEKPVFYKQEDNLVITREDIVCGFVSTVRKALKSLDINPPYLDYPEQLKHFLRRPIREDTLGNVRVQIHKAHEFQGNVPNWKGIFCKPRECQKAFTGTVFKNVAQLAYVNDFHDSFPVWTANPVNFLSEWRCYILNGEIVGARPYTGDFRVPVDWSEVDKMVECYKPAPAAYSIDIGVIQSDLQSTALIEVNDFIALGNYGIGPKLYAKCVKARWQELTKKPSVDEPTEGFPLT